LTNTPVATRYFNIWVFTLVLLFGLLGCQLLKLVRSLRVRAAFVAAFCLLLFLELLPFRPVIGAFWPWWANAAALPVTNTAEPGKRLPVWMGWGEEPMIVGRHLREMAEAGQLTSDSFRLFTAYLGDWLTPDRATKNPALIGDNIKLETTEWVETAPLEGLSFTENDYYIVNLASVINGRFLFPKDKKPFWTIEYRGVPEAWVFRGSDIKDVYYAKGCPFIPVADNMWMAEEQLSESMPSDGPSTPAASRLVIYEDGKPLGPAHANPEKIQRLGEGRYSHWGRRLYFSTSDNSNPNTNGRTYELRIDD